MCIYITEKIVVLSVSLPWQTQLIKAQNIFLLWVKDLTPLSLSSENVKTYSGCWHISEIQTQKHSVFKHLLFFSVCSIHRGMYLGLCWCRQQSQHTGLLWAPSLEVRVYALCSFLILVKGSHEMDWRHFYILYYVFSYDKDSWEKDIKGSFPILVHIKAINHVQHCYSVAGGIRRRDITFLESILLAKYLDMPASV